MRYFLDLSYRGSNYHGWQIQNNAISVQQIVEEKLSTLLRSSTEITASGRTDTGVHAEQQIIHFDTNQQLPEDFLFRLNCILPEDIAAKGLRAVKETAHARFDATSRAYAYRISLVKNPFTKGLSWQFTRPLNIEKMNQAAEKIKHYKDFKSFSKVHTDVSHFLCDIQEAIWEKQNDMLVFKIRANRFLRGMVRAIVGTLVEIGLGKMEISEIEQIILSANRSAAGAAAPPDGLFLTEITYPDHIFL